MSPIYALAGTINEVVAIGLRLRFERPRQCQLNITGGILPLFQPQHRMANSSKSGNQTTRILGVQIRPRFFFTEIWRRRPPRRRRLAYRKNPYSNVTRVCNTRALAIARIRVHHTVSMHPVNNGTQRINLLLPSPVQLLCLPLPPTDQRNLLPQPLQSVSNACLLRNLRRSRNMYIKFRLC